MVAHAQKTIFVYGRNGRTHILIQWMPEAGFCVGVAPKLGRTPSCVKTRRLRHDAKKGAQLKRMRLWKPPHTGLSHDADVSFMLQTRAARLGMFLFCASRFRHRYSRNGTSVRYRHDVMSSTREDVIRCRHVLLRCADSSLNHEWSKIASFASCLDACLDAAGVRCSALDVSRSH
jgi:hypothetical protein